MKHRSFLFFFLISGKEDTISVRHHWGMEIWLNNLDLRDLTS